MDMRRRRASRVAQKGDSAADKNLLPHLDFRVEAVLDALARVMPQPDVLRVSARTGEGVAGWIGWLEGRRAAQAKAAPAGRLD